MIVVGHCVQAKTDEEVTEHGQETIRFYHEVEDFLIVSDTVVVIDFDFAELARS